MKEFDDKSSDLVDRQINNASHKKSNVFTVILFCVLFISVGILFFVLPDKTYLETERRIPASAPSVFEDIGKDIEYELKTFVMSKEQKAEYEETNGKHVTFADKVTEYYADQFPLREQLRKIKALAELMLLKQENNGVVYSNGYLIKKDTLNDNVSSEKAVENIEKNTENLAKMQDLTPENITFTSVLAPRTVDAAKNTLPALFPYFDTNADVYWDAYYTAADEKGLEITDVKGELTERFSSGGKVYYKTDHHWTTLGAYYAYKKIAEDIGIVPYELSDFEISEFCNDFKGTTYAKAGAAFEDDKIELFRFDKDEDFTVKIYSEDTLDEPDTVLNGFYNFAYKSESDKYSVFIGSDNLSYGGNNAVTTVTKNGEKREKLLLIKDSFGNCAVPFLSRHFDLIIVDMRAYYGSLSDFLKDENLKHILMLYNMETYQNDTSALTRAAYEFERAFR